MLVQVGDACQPLLAVVGRASNQGTSLSVYFANVNPGRYRVAIHAQGNCTSPNGFSAGAPWVPPGANGPLVIEFAVDQGGSAMANLQLFRRGGAQ